MGAGFNMTFPSVPLTGRERSLEELSEPDERSTGYGLSVEALQAPYLEIESPLPHSAPPKLRQAVSLSPATFSKPDAW